MNRYFLVYKTVNLVTNEFYIGVHETVNLADAYLGSGVRIRRSVLKYGPETFQREILHYASSRAEMYELEAKIVTLELCGTDLCLNIKPGGDGGWNIVNRVPYGDRCNFKTAQEFSKMSALGTANATQERKSRALLNPESTRAQTLAASLASRSEEINIKRKASLASIQHQQGSNNSQFGTCWMYSESLRECKKIKLEESSSFIASGWTRGRKKFA